ncbi:BCL2/adenovirus E1B 19 kDa protein-interacting protein 3, partial [Trachymyrmex cornetzi]
ESWVELVPDQPLAARTTPTPFSITGEREYLRLLREAQRDSTHSSAKHSLASSRRDTPRDSKKRSVVSQRRGMTIRTHGELFFFSRASSSSVGAQGRVDKSCRRRVTLLSPKSPPNSPNTELSTEDELKGVYINYGCNKEGELLEKNTDWIYEWSSRPDQAPPKDWKFKHPLGSKRKTYSIRTAKVGKNGLFSKEVIYTLFFTNLLSLLIGTGLGVLLTRRGLMMSRVAIE